MRRVGASSLVLPVIRLTGFLMAAARPLAFAFFSAWYCTEHLFRCSCQVISFTLLFFTLLADRRRLPSYLAIDPLQLASFLHACGPALRVGAGMLQIDGPF